MPVRPISVLSFLKVKMLSSVPSGIFSRTPRSSLHRELPAQLLLGIARFGGLVHARQPQHAAGIVEQDADGAIELNLLSMRTATRLTSGGGGSWTMTSGFRPSKSTFCSRCWPRKTACELGPAFAAHLAAPDRVLVETELRFQRLARPASRSSHAGTGARDCSTATSGSAHRPARSLPAGSARQSPFFPRPTSSRPQNPCLLSAGPPRTSAGDRRRFRCASS